MYLMDITALITPIHSAAMLRNTVFVYQDKKQKHQVLFQNTLQLFFLSLSHDSVFRGIVHPKRFFLENMLCICLQGQKPQIQYVWTALMGFILRQV